MPKTQRRPKREKEEKGWQKKQRKKVIFCKEDGLRGLQGRLPPSQVHLRPGQDPGPPGHGQLRPAPARGGHGRQERPGDGALPYTAR